MNELDEIFKLCNTIFENADIDFEELEEKNIDEEFFLDYQNVRIVNSFLFNFSKLQDKIGAKLFKKTLYELKEIDNQNIPMRDLLNLLEKLGILNSYEWDELREIRNSLSHEYPFSIEERIENINLALDGYKKLKEIYEKIRLILFDT